MYDIGLLNNIIRFFCIGVFTHYTFLKIINFKNSTTLKIVLILILNVVISIIYSFARQYLDIILAVIVYYSLHSIVLHFITKKKIGYSVFIFCIAFSISYVGLIISALIQFAPQRLLTINNWTINFIIAALIQAVLLYSFFKIKKFKHGFTFLQKQSSNEYIDIFILSASIIISFIFLLVGNLDTAVDDSVATNLLILLMFIATIMVAMVYKTLALNYKQKLLKDELLATKLEIEEKKIELQELEEENLAFSKTSHSIAHRQKSLEFKLNQLLLSTETAMEFDIADRIKSICEDFNSSLPLIELPKTEIIEIDDMLNVMQNECHKDNISMSVQLNGNIHHMVNNFVSKEDLEILIADFIKNSIIAINSSSNTNRSILVKLGLANTCYGLSVYDSGIEFNIGTLIDLGVKPATTHSDTGGTGIGYMNTFDTLKKYNASLVITEKNEPNGTDYTKYVAIRFDNEGKYVVRSYRSEKIIAENRADRLIIEFL